MYQNPLLDFEVRVLDRGQMAAGAGYGTGLSKWYNLLMKDKAARFIFSASIAVLLLSCVMLWKGVEPFTTHFYIFAWWSLIGILDSRLYIKGGDSLFIAKPVDFLTFLVPFSAFLWFVFEGYNLRIQNWQYVGVPAETWVRWPGNFIAFGTVVPAIFLIANTLEHSGFFRKNEFSQFFSEELSRAAFLSLVLGGAAMLLLPLLVPKLFFPLVWGGFVLLLDPINAQWRGKSLIQEWRQGNMNRTWQILLAGLLCGGIWELMNFWAGAKWVYTVPLPEILLNNLKIFEMPVLGFLGFPPFALECFVMAEFARNLKERASRAQWTAAMAGALVFSLFMCHMMDIYTVRSFQ